MCQIMLFVLIPHAMDFAAEIIDQRQYVRPLEQYGSVGYEYWSDDFEPWIPEPVRRLLGNDLFYDVTFVQLWGDQVTDHSIELLATIPTVRSVYISGIAHKRMAITHPTKITDAGLEHFSKMKNLTWLVLTDAEITDQGLRTFLNMPQLQYLRFQRTKITETGLAELRCGLPNCDIRDMNLPPP